jgi:putative phosphoesterase
MKILIVSDTHGHETELNIVINKTRPFDYLIHCGDTEGHEGRIREMAACPCTIVKGNNDFFSDLEKEEEITFGRYRILVVHGHQYGVSMTTAMLKDEAKSRGFNIVMYGHTHRPSIDMSDPEVTVINPGSLAYPRQEGRRPSYIIMEIDRHGEAHFALNMLE